MKHILPLIIAVLLATFTFGQETTGTAPYEQSKTIPSINLLTTDSAWYNLRTNSAEKNVAVIYFSHDCKHCQSEAKEIAANSAMLKDVQLLWISSMSSIDEIKNFRHQYGLTGSNITFLKDPNFSIALFYDVKTLPFIALYDKAGQTRKLYRKAVTAEGIVAAFQ